MKIDSKFVGSPLKEYNCQINWREIMNYAAAINDNNNYYFDDETKDGIVAPPNFCLIRNSVNYNNVQSGKNKLMPHFI